MLLEISGFLHRNEYLKRKGDVLVAPGITTSTHDSGTKTFEEHSRKSFKECRRVRSVGEEVVRSM